MNSQSASVSPDLIGYCDRFEYQPGGAVDVYVHGSGMAKVDLVRLHIADERVAASLPLEEVVPNFGRLAVELQPQETHPGSFSLVEHVAALHNPKAVTIELWVWPSLLDAAEDQGIVSALDDQIDSGFALVLARDNHLELRVGAVGGWRVAVRSDKPLLPRTWCRISARLSVQDAVAELVQHPKRALPDGADATHLRTRLEDGVMLGNPGDWMLIGAGSLRRDQEGRPFAHQCFNGKIEAVRLGAAQKANERPMPVAAWDFSREIAGDRVLDTEGVHHGTLHNMPTRAVTGHDWRGDEVDFRLVADQYAAIHFHDDDLEDAGWTRTAQLHLPEDLPSGIYAVRIVSGAGQDRIPLFVMPRPGAPRPPIAFLVPTFTYQAYANAMLDRRIDYKGKGLSGRAYTLGPRDDQLFAHAQLGGSLYDCHSDGSGRCYSSMRRPIFNLRADYLSAVQQAPRHFPADLYLTGWLDHRGYAYDVITDHALDEGGIDLLKGYRVLITGSHPEYVSGRMERAVERFVATGGRLMYLGANGFYWVTSRDHHRPHVIECRRGHAGTRTWTSAPGELHHSTTGEAGGLWRHRGRPPNQLLGIGMTSQGWDARAPGFERTEAGRDPRYAWIFEGVEGERFGEEGLVMGGASGDELDRFDIALGSPSHGVVLATSLPHSDYYKLVVEDVPMTTDGLGGAANDKVRSDMVYVEWPEGGAVFSVGSITWAGALAWNDYDNAAERITRNVLARFLSASST